MTQRKRRRNTWTKWRRLISEQMRSGESVAAFCRERKLRASHFYWWKKRLRENTTARFVEVQVAESPANLPGDSRIEVRLQNGRSLMVGRGFDPEHVRGLLAVIGLPSLQAIDRAQGARIWMASEATDMRCGFDRLAERVKTVIGENPQSGHLFVFRSRRGDRLKILVWDRDGFVLWYKRLEAGVFKVPRVEQGARSVELRASELAMILDGIDVAKLKRLPRYQRAIESCG
jgi:transposase